MTKNFRLNVIIRILIITLIIALLMYFILIQLKYLRSVYLGIFLVIAIVEFVWYVDRTNRDFASFLLALLQDDFTTTFSEKGKGKSFGMLYSAFNKITQKFKRISSAKEVQHIYLEMLVEHVKVGILSYNKEERIHLMNNALKQLLNKPQALYLNSLASVNQQLLDTIREIKPGENKLVKIAVRNELLELSIHATEFKVEDDHYKLVSLQNIKHELEANELEAWQKLIRVLTHEIMNSVAPITSLTGTLQGIVEKKVSDNETLDGQTTDNLLKGLDAIMNRSAGLQSFTEAYRNLTRIPTPKFQSVDVNKMLERIEILLRPDLENIDFKIDASAVKQHISADADLLDQVLINLVKNALYAVKGKEKPKISIAAVQEEKTKIIVSDNGTGVDPDKLDQIFIPFFTTKKNGSGIGLALSKQILMLHGGTIQVSSVLGEGTRFTITI